MFNEFKKFALKGSVIDLAVGVIIGGAFGNIVSSLVKDIIMPILGIITGNINLTALKIVIKPGNESAGVQELSVNYGQFLQTTIDFILIALSIFLVIKAISKFRRKQEEKPPEAKPTKEELLLTEIRDILKEK